MKKQNIPAAASRKQDHIALAFESQVKRGMLDDRFYYEPMIAAHPDRNTDIGLEFLGRRMEAPIWISSMTGGTEKAGVINRHLAQAAGAFKLGMGLGSCRSLLEDKSHLADFDLRHWIGEQPFFANLGIAQIEQLIAMGGLHRVEEMLKMLQADGLIIHVNPLQEWIQPEGDIFSRPPIDTIRRFLDAMPETPVIVKEVGQGFGPESMAALVRLPLAAIDFGAAGGTNFSKLEHLRSEKAEDMPDNALASIGHTAEEMLQFLAQALHQETALTGQVIISGGVKDFLDGYYLVSHAPVKAVYGQASAFLKYAVRDYSSLSDFVSSQIEAYRLAKALLRIKPK